jgi:signal transduction histidine kinase
MKNISFLLTKANPATLIPYNESRGRVSSGKKIADIISWAQENERKMIGRELHDNVNQILSTVKIFIEMLHPQGEREKDIQNKSVEYMIMAIDEIRRISRELVAPKQKMKALADSINTIIDDIHFSTPIKIVFRHHPAIENLDEDKKTALLRIVQEQLKNIMTYSKAKEVVIKIDVRDGKVIMEIKDNGVGFDAAKITKGIGLSNIYERAIFFKRLFQPENGFGERLCINDQSAGSLIS